MKQTWSFEVLCERQGKRLFTAHWGTDNLEWMKLIGKDDTVVFSDVSMPGPAGTVTNILDQVPHPESFIFLCNDYEVYQDRFKHGLNAYFINQNAFIDESRIDIDEGVKKEYDVVYNARLRPVKRHFLADKVGKKYKLALIVGHHTPSLSSIPDVEIPKHVFMNNFQLLPESISKLLNKSKVGLILSESEGACFASSEYLLAGLPVVSTKSRGGRDFWYDDYNSVVCDPDPDSVLEAVKTLLKEPRNPRVIRESHIKKMFMHRQKFADFILKPFLSGAFPEIEIDRIFDEFSFRRYLAFQSKYGWKSFDSIVTYIKEGRSEYEDPERFQPAIVVPEHL